MHCHNRHLLQQQHHHHHPKKPTPRRSLCPSRSRSAEGGYHYEIDAGIRVDSSSAAVADPAMATTTRRRRRRQRTQSRPRPHRVVSGEGVAGGSSGGIGGVYGLTNYYALDNSAADHAAADEPRSEAAAPSRLQFQMLLADSSDTTSDGDVMDVEMG